MKPKFDDFMKTHWRWSGVTNMLWMQDVNILRDRTQRKSYWTTSAACTQKQQFQTLPKSCIKVYVTCIQPERINKGFISFRCLSNKLLAAIYDRVKSCFLLPKLAIRENLNRAWNNHTPTLTFKSDLFWTNPEKIFFGNLSFRSIGGTMSDI